MELAYIDNIHIHFDLVHRVNQVIPFGNGHINDTYRLATDDPGGHSYLLQRINHEIFKDVPALMNNVRRVTDHISKKLTDQEKFNGQTALHVIPTNEGMLFHKDANGNYWRIYDFLKDLESHDKPSSLDQIYQGAKSFGTFLSLLSDFSANSLHITIDRFHDANYRLDNLSKAVELDPVNRSVEVQEELTYISSVSKKLSCIQRLANSSEIPLRVTHNDTKFNNVMLGHDDKGKCVVDLDTVMPGYVHYDFGDGVRTTISETAEDEANLDKINIDLKRFEAFASGYLEPTRNILTVTEINHLALSGPLFSFIMAARFLTDYISGDQYYKTDFADHNIQRVKAQLDLTKKMLAQLPEMEQVIKKLTV